LQRGAGVAAAASELGVTTRERGMVAEAFAAQTLEDLGYRIAERNLRTRGAELDIVAWEGETLCIVEVRYTATHDFGGPLATVSEDKKRRLRRGARAYLQTLGKEPAVRFDVVGVTGEPAALAYELVRGAFREER
jgi:putative endonuclease